jgi:WD40 repeat protein
VAKGAGVKSPPDVPPEKRLGGQTSGGLTFGANASQRGGAVTAGANPSRRFAVASDATILVSTGGKDPIVLGEKQAFTRDAALHVWDWSKSDKSRPLEVSSPSFSVSPDGKWIVTIKGEKIEIATGKVAPLPGFEREPNRTLFSPDGRRLALLLDEKNNTSTFRILEFPEGRKLCDIENQWPAMLPAAFGPDGSEIFLMGKDNFVRRFDAVTGKELQKYEPAHANSVRRMIASPSGNLLVSGGSRGDILLWDVASGKLLHKLVVVPAAYADQGVYSLAFSPDETQVAGGGVGSLLLWSVATAEVKTFPRGSASAEHLSFSVDGKTITAVSGFSGTAGPAGESLLVYPNVSKWNVADGK